MCTEFSQYNTNIVTDIDGTMKHLHKVIKILETDDICRLVVGAQICRILLLHDKRSCKTCRFMQNFIDYLRENKNDNTDNNASHSKEYIRKIIKNYANYNGILQLASPQEYMFTIGSHAGILRSPIVGIYYFT